MKNYDSCLFLADSSNKHNFLDSKSLHYVQGAQTMKLRKKH